MSASEKLERLGERHDGTAPYELEDALPEIIAVVEAAEEADPRRNVITQREERQRRRILRRALTALDERLP